MEKMKNFIQMSRRCAASVSVGDSLHIFCLKLIEWTLFDKFVSFFNDFQAVSVSFGSWFDVCSSELDDGKYDKADST